jgi:predicted  nucleic acid-binding Zn-ribbon protein
MSITQSIAKWDAQISQHMADGDIDAIDHIIQGLKNAKTDLKSEIAAYEVSLAGIQNILKAKKLELERVDKKINANENGKEALLSIKRAYED